MKTIIYALKDPRTNLIRYVGKTVKRLKKRLQEHVSQAMHRKRPDNTYKINWIRSLHENGLRPEIMELGAAEGDGCREERAWIAYMKEEGFTLVNATDGGEGNLGWVPSQQTRERIRAARKGKPLSEEARRNISLGHIGLKRTPETCAKISAIHKGRRMSEVSRKKMSESAVRKWTSPVGELLKKKLAERSRNAIVSEETRRKLSIAHKGRKHTEEAIRKMAIARLGTKLSEETKAKVGASTLERWKNKELREKMLAGIRRVGTRRKTPLTDEERAANTARMKSCWADPVWRAARVAAMKAAYEANKKAPGACSAPGATGEPGTALPGESVGVLCGP